LQIGRLQHVSAGNRSGHQRLPRRGRGRRDRGAGSVVWNSGRRLRGRHAIAAIVGSLARPPAWPAGELQDSEAFRLHRRIASVTRGQGGQKGLAGHQRRANAMNPIPPTLEAIAAARERLGQRIRETPVWQWRGREIEALAGERTQVFVKMELLQYAGTFKPRGAVLNALAMSEAARRQGITAVSAGNHAIAAAFAARAVGTSAKVVMSKTANPARVALCGAYGAEVVLADDTADALARVKRIEQEESRTLIHPFEGERTVLGTATLGYEWCRQVEDLDAVIVPIGGGGLCAGIASAVKQMQPRCQVFGVEPEGADTMHRSFAAGSPQAIDRISTIADSLSAPHA